jgi:hypothetical protein
MDKTFVSKVYSGQDDYCDADWAILEISPGCAWLMLQRMDMATAQKGRDGTLYALSFWDSLPTFVRYDTLPEELADKVEDEELVLLDHPLPVAEDNIAAVECGQVIVRPDEIYWKAYLKHTSIALETATLPRALLEEMAQPAMENVPEVG